MKQKKAKETEQKKSKGTRKKKRKDPGLLEIVEKHLRDAEKGLDEILSTAGALPPDVNAKLNEVRDHLTAIHPFQKFD